MQGRGSGKVRDFALYGETTGETDDSACPFDIFGRPNIAARRCRVWAYAGTTARWINRTVNIDTGCVFGGTLDRA